MTCTLPYRGEMTGEDKAALAAEIADELQDSVGIGTEADRELTARCVIDRIEHALYQQGWMPPGTSDRVHAWVRQTAGLPEHHVNQSVLLSQLAELIQILQDR
jgi:hypothetical protein